MGRGVNGRAHKSRSQCKDGKSLHFGAVDKRTQMPVCKYGPACTRSDCIYRHPKGEVEKSSTACMAYVAGVCSFGSKCTNRHPSADEVDALIEKYARIPCRFGQECFNQACLYSHGAPETNTGDAHEGSSSGPDPRLAKVRAFLMQKKTTGMGREVAVDAMPYDNDMGPDGAYAAYIPPIDALADGEWSTGQNGNTAASDAPVTSSWGMMDGLSISGLPFRPSEEAEHSVAQGSSNTTLSATASEFVPSW